MCAHLLSHVPLFMIPWTVACQVPLFMEFSTQEYWSGLSFPSPQDIPNPGIEPVSPAYPAVAGRFFNTVPPGKCNWKYTHFLYELGDSQVVLVVKKLFAIAGDIRDMGSIPGLGKSPGIENGNPLLYSCLQNPMDRGAWQATVHSVTESWTWRKWLSMQA